MNPKIKSLIQARQHAVKLIDSLAAAFDLSPRQVRSVLDAIWDLYLDADHHCETGTDGLAHFVRGFKDVLANLEHAVIAPTPQPAAMAA
jgi:hypothetical protein